MIHHFGEENCFDLGFTVVTKAEIKGGNYLDPKIQGILFISDLHRSFANGQKIKTQLVTGVSLYSQHHWYWKYQYIEIFWGHILGLHALFTCTGYARVLLNCVGFTICFSDKKLFSFRYFISFLCDALDGWFAQKFNQASTFGAVLDMLTDRISTACLLVILSQVYRPSSVFLALLALDISSHWLQMYSTFVLGKASHKDVKDSNNWLFKAYHGNRMFLGYCCTACEVLYLTLFLLAKNQTEHILDMKTAADIYVLYDIEKKQKR